MNQKYTWKKVLKRILINPKKKLISGKEMFQKNGATSLYDLYEDQRGTYYFSRRNLRDKAIYEVLDAIDMSVAEIR